jgi:capsular exopolysaccharide synthesis family protein
MELRRYIAITWRWSWLLVLGTLLGGLVAFFVSRAQTPVYSATATVLVNQAQAATGPTYNDILANQQLTKTYARLVTSGPVLDEVAQRFDLPFPQAQKMVSAGAGRDTQLIDISVKSTDRDLAARMANETAAIFADQIRQAQLGQQATVESDIENQLKAVQAVIAERQQQAVRLSTPQLGLDEAQRLRQLSDTQSQLESLRQNETSLQRQLQDVRITLARSINSVTLADPARVPERPISPRTMLNTALGAFLAFLVVAGIVALAEYLDDTVKNADDVDRFVGVPSLGSIPSFTPRQGRIPGRRTTMPRLITQVGGQSPIAEAYRMVRTNLEFARNHRSGKTLLITSALPGEGKTTTAANLAIMLAESGRRVILVDADLRKRRLHQLFGIANTTGLSTLFVLEEPNLKGLLRPTQHGNLRMLPAGPAPPNPAELLASARMGDILRMLAEEADVVVFDSPPLLPVADTAGLAPAMDGVVLVVDSGRTRMNALVQAAEVLARADAAVWGVILNKMKPGRGGAYYYYGRYQSDTDDPSGPRPPREAGFPSGAHWRGNGRHAPRPALEHQRLDPEWRGAAGEAGPIVQARTQEQSG